MDEEAASIDRQLQELQERQRDLQRRRQLEMARMERLRLLTECDEAAGRLATDQEEEVARAETRRAIQKCLENSQAYWLWRLETEAAATRRLEAELHEEARRRQTAEAHLAAALPAQAVHEEPEESAPARDPPAARPRKQYPAPRPHLTPGAARGNMLQLSLTPQCADGIHLIAEAVTKVRDFNALRSAIAQRQDFLGAWAYNAPRVEMWTAERMEELSTQELRDLCFRISRRLEVELDRPPETMLLDEAKMAVESGAMAEDLAPLLAAVIRPGSLPARLAAYAPKAAGELETDRQRMAEIGRVEGLDQVILARGQAGADAAQPNASELELIGRRVFIAEVFAPVLTHLLRAASDGSNRPITKRQVSEILQSGDDHTVRSRWTIRKGQTAFPL